MSHVGSYLQTLLFGFSGFWRRQFQDAQVLETIQRGTDILFGNVYAESLRLAQATALQEASVAMQEHWRHFDVQARDTVRVTLGGRVVYAVPLPDYVLHVPTLQNSVLTPTTVLEDRRDYEVTDVPQLGRSLVFYEDPFARTDLVPQIVNVDPRTVASSDDGRVSYGTPNTHIPISAPNRAELLSERTTARRTFTSTGRVYATQTARAFSGSERQILVDTEQVPVLVAGGTVTVGAPFNVQRTVTRVSAPGVMDLDQPIAGLGAASSFSVEVVRPDIFAARDVGATIRLETRDATNSRRTEDFKIVTVLSPLSVLLSRPVQVVEVNAPRVTATYNHLTSTITYLSADARLSWRDVGSWIYMVSAGSEGFVEVESLSNFNANGYALTVVVNDVNGLFDASGAVDVSHYPTNLDLTNVNWELVTAPVDTRLVLWAPSTVIPSPYISDLYGVYVGRTQEVATEAYKALVRGVFQYYEQGPTRATLRTVLNVIGGLPTVRTDGEIFQRLEHVADGTVVVTSTARYLLPAAAVREDLLTAAAGSITFSALEPLSNVFEVLDERIDPVWYRNLVLPLSILPNTSVDKRRVEDDLRYLQFDGTWSIGDPGVVIGGSPELAADVLQDLECFANGTTLTTFEPAFWPTDVGKLAYVNNRLTRIAAFTSRVEIELDQDFTAAFEPTLRALVEAIGSAMTIEDDPEQPYAFGPAEAGSLFYYEAGARFVRMRQRLSARTALFDELDGTPLAEPMTASGLWRTSTLDLVRQPPGRFSPGYMVARAYAGANLFGVRYNLAPVAAQVPQIQRDLTDIVLSGRLAHTYMLDLPYTMYSDTIDVSDVIQAGVVLGTTPLGQQEVFPATAHALQVGGPWNVGDVFHVAPGQLVWTHRMYAGNTLPAIAAPATTGLSEPGVIDARSTDVLWLDLVSSQTGVLYDVEVYAWNGTTFVATGVTATFDVDAPLVQSVSVPSTYLALHVERTTPGTREFALQVGMVPTAAFTVVNMGNFPLFTGSIATGSDILTTVEELYAMDKYRMYTLRYEASPGVWREDVVLAIDVPSLNTLQLVSYPDFVPYDPPTTTAAVEVRFCAHLGWGQTPVTLGIAQPLLTTSPPPGVGSGQPFGVELPVQIRLHD